MELVSDRDCHCTLLINSGDLFKIENSFKKKCSVVEKSFWSLEFPQILDEFDSEEDSNLPKLKKSASTEKPDFDSCVEIMVKKLAWTEEYAVEKMLPVLTRWQVQALTGGLKGYV